MAEKRASSGGGAGSYKSNASTYYSRETYQNAMNMPYRPPVNDRKPLGVSSGAIEPRPREAERMEIALD